VNPAAVKPAVATTDAADNDVAKLVEAKDAARAVAKVAMSVPPKSRATPLAPSVLKALVDVAEAIVQTVAVAKKLPRQKLQTQLFQQRLWPPMARPPSALRVKNPKVAVVVVDAVNAQAQPLQTHKCF
jgi:hypothetical protein